MSRRPSLPEDAGPRPHQATATDAGHNQRPLTRREAAALIACAAGAASLADAVPENLRAMLLAAFVLVGPGTATLVWYPRMQRPIWWGLTPVVGLSLVALLTSAAARLQWWHPTAMTVVLVSLSAASVLLRRWRRQPAPGDAAATPRPEGMWNGGLRSGFSAKVALWLLVAGVALWVAGAVEARVAADSDYGLLPASPLLLTSLLAFAASALAGIRAGSPARVLAAAAAMTLHRATAALITEVPLYSWTYKHLGVVDSIQDSGALSGVDIYSGWPGFLATAAWFGDQTGVAEVGMATWYPPLIHLVYLAAIVAACCAWGLGPLQSATGGFLFESLNWVGQDYFAPQSLGMLLAIGVVALMGGKCRPPGWVGLLLLVFTALVVTHQLTPYWLIILSIALVAVRSLRPWWLPAALAGLAGSWLVLNWGVAGQFVGISLDLVANADTSEGIVGSSGASFTGAAIRVLAILTWSSALAAAIWDRRKGRPVVDRLAVFLTPIAILLGQDYGGEALYRVYLYSLVGAVLLIAPALVRLMQSPRFVAATAAVTVSAAAALSAQGYFGAFYADRMSADDVVLSQWLHDRVAPPAYLLPAAPGWPSRITGDYVGFAEFDRGFDLPVVFGDEDQRSASFDTPADYSTFMEYIQGLRDAPVYLIITDTMDVHGSHYGYGTPGSIDRLRTEVAADRRWVLLRDESSAQVYVLSGSATGSQSASTGRSGD